MVSWTYLVQTKPYKDHMNPGNFALLGRYVRTKIEKIRSSILEGDAEVSPYELGKKNANYKCFGIPGKYSKTSSG